MVLSCADSSPVFLCSKLGLSRVVCCLLTAGSIGINLTKKRHFNESH